MALFARAIGTAATTAAPCGATAARRMRTPAASAATTATAATAAIASPTAAAASAATVAPRTGGQRRLFSRSLAARSTAAATATAGAGGLPVSMLTPATSETDMFCFQCEQTSEGKGCTTVGVCGKTPTVAAVQDLLVQACKEIAWYLERRPQGAPRDREADRALLDFLFATLTNVNFDEAAFVRRFLADAARIRDRLRAAHTGAERLPASFRALEWRGADAASEFYERQGRAVGVAERERQLGSSDLVALQELVAYGLKGTAAYAHHARMLDGEDDALYAAISRTLAALVIDEAHPPQVGALLQLAMDVGGANLLAMRLLDARHTARFGAPAPTRLRTTPVAGKAVLVSGHDLRDLELVLKATEGRGINVYTHGELLPAHAYPALRRYPHLVGNYGGAWQLQKIEFAAFPGPILMTTNCIIEPRKSYAGRIFTRGVVGWPGVQHIGEDDDMAPLVERALAMPGFAKDAEPARHVTTGFGHDAVMGVAGQVVDAVKSGAVRHFFLIGGCDGAEGERSYFRDVALATPPDSMILTLACGKYRFNALPELQGLVPNTQLPRMLDIGQCNDAYSAIQIASALASAFNTDVNGLPLSFCISWFEQKAVAVLLTLLSLGVKNIYLGPNLPAFATPAVLDVLVNTYGLRKTATPAGDLGDMLLKK